MRRLLIVLLSFAALVGLPPAHAHAEPCNPSRAFSASHYSYRLCNVADVDQRRAGLTGNGGLFCVPTSVTDLLIHLGKTGWVSQPDPDKDWTDPANYNELTGDIAVLAALMHTLGGGIPGTVPTDAEEGIRQWMLSYATPHDGTSIGHITVRHYFGEGTDHFSTAAKPLEPADMAKVAVNGSLVEAGVGFYDATKNPPHTGGHFVALVGADGAPGAATSTLLVRDPFTSETPADLNAQSPYTTDTWNLSKLAPGSYSVTSDHYGLGTPGGDTRWGEYFTIDPRITLTIAKKVVFHAPIDLFDGGTPNDKLIAPPGKVADAALSPLTGEVPLLVRGSNAVYVLDRLTGQTQIVAKGPAGASHLAIGGPALNVYVAGTKQLQELGPAGKVLASQPLRARVQSLAYDEHGQRLVALSNGVLRFYGPDLKPTGALALPKSFKRATAADVAIAPGGTPVVHKAGARILYALATSRPTPVALKGVKQPKGLAIDDDGHLYVSDGGALVELDPNGVPVADSAYDGVRSTGLVRIDHTYSNLPNAPMDNVPDGFADGF